MGGMGIFWNYTIVKSLKSTSKEKSEKFGCLPLLKLEDSEFERTPQISIIVVTLIITVLLFVYLSLVDVIIIIMMLRGELTLTLLHEIFVTC